VKGALCIVGSQAGRQKHFLIERGRSKLTRILPPRVASREIKLAKFVLTPFGLASDSVGDVTIDGRIALIQPHPEAELYLCPFSGQPHPSVSTAWFCADCLSFDHEIPVIVRPTDADIRRFGYRYIYSGSAEPQEITYENLDSGESRPIYRKRLSPEAQAKLFFRDQLFSILSEIRGLHHGPLTFVIFRHQSREARRDLPYSCAYGPVSQEIHIYAMALRQADTLSEFLVYYRVIESIAHSNGKTWVAAALGRIRGHRFDDIQIGMIDDRKTASLLPLYHRRATRRLTQLLKARQSLTGVAAYLYHVNRCGIAHGRCIVRADITPSYFEMVRDTYLMKLLARLAIEERLGQNRL